MDARGGDDAIAGFAIAVVIWWAYFAHPHAELLERGRLASFIWGYGHIFVWMGIAITGIGIELAIEAAAAGHSLSDGERLILCGGPALYLVAMAILRRRAPAISPIVWCWFGWRRQSRSSSSGSPAGRCRRRQLPS